MTDFMFVPVEEMEGAPPLIIGLSGMSDSGKTYSALLIAKAIITATSGITAVIDTEGRTAKYKNAKFYPELHPFQVARWEPPFNGDRLVQACQSAVKAGAGCIVVDSATDEWEGDGGVLQMQEHFLAKMAGNDYAKRERMNMAAWAKAKAPHSRWHAHLLGMSVPIILCHRARPKIKMVKDGKKTKIVDVGVQPICDTRIVHDMMFHLLMDEQKRDGSYSIVKGGYKHERSVFPGGRIDPAAIKRLVETVLDADAMPEAEPEKPEDKPEPEPETRTEDKPPEEPPKEEAKEPAPKWELGSSGDFRYKLAGGGDENSQAAQRALYSRLMRDLKPRERTPVVEKVTKGIVAANMDRINGLPPKGKEAIMKLVNEQGFAPDE